MSTTPLHHMSRPAMLIAGLAATALAVRSAVDHGPAVLSVLIVFAVAPDLTLFIGAGEAPAPGVLAARAVPYYNLVHRAWFPLVLAAAGAAVSSPIIVTAGCAWFAHVAIDRAVGYGLRTADGRQRRAVGGQPG